MKTIQRPLGIDESQVSEDSSDEAKDVNSLESCGEEEADTTESFFRDEDSTTNIADVSSSATNKLGVLPLAVIVFYNVSGGPFGIETAVRAGGNLFALAGFLIGPLVWSLQEVS